jgi:hypothetical protein
MFALEQQFDVFVDAMAADPHGHLLFLSVFGRDTSVQQLMARMHQRANQGGVDDLTALHPVSRQAALRVLVGDPNRLDKLTGRMPRTPLLGNLVHAWIFDPAVLSLDMSTGAAWLIEPMATDDAQHRTQQALQVWRLVRELSPVPLLAHWMLPVLSYLQSQQALKRPPCVGRIDAVRLELPPNFMAWVSDCVSTGLLTEQAPGAADGNGGTRSTDSAMGLAA